MADTMKDLVHISMDRQMIEADRATYESRLTQAIDPLRQWLGEKYDDSLVEYPIAEEACGGRLMGRLNITFEHRQQLVGCSISLSPSSGKVDVRYGRHVCDNIEDLPTVADLQMMTLKNAQEAGLGAKVHATYFSGVRPVVLSIGGAYHVDNLPIAIDAMKLTDQLCDLRLKLY